MRQILKFVSIVWLITDSDYDDFWNTFDPDWMMTSTGLKIFNLFDVNLDTITSETVVPRIFLDPSQKIKIKCVSLSAQINYHRRVQTKHGFRVLVLNQSTCAHPLVGHRRATRVRCVYQFIYVYIENSTGSKYPARGPR